MEFTKTGCLIFNRTGDLVATAALTNGVYKLNIVSRRLAAAVTTSGEVWHRRMGHVHSDCLMKTKNAVEGMDLNEKVDITKSSCKTCCEGKQCRLPFKHVGTRSSDLLDRVHTDLCGPMEAVSLGGSVYFQLFVDDFSRMTFIYFLKHKNEALKCFKEFKAMAENQTNRKVKIVRSDNGKEFCNSSFEAYLKEMGIIHQKSNPYTPEQNSLCERQNRSVVEKARCMLYDAELDKKFWAEACHTAVYLHNRTVSSVLEGKTPYELWTGMKPDLSNIRIFGSPVMVHIEKQKRTKWDKKSRECILLGYPDNIKGYRIYDPKTKKISTSRDIIVMEKPSESYSIMEVENKDKEEAKDQELQDSVGEENTESTLTEESASDTSSEYVPSEYEDTIDTTKVIADTAKVISRPVRQCRAPERYGFDGVFFYPE